MPIRYDIADGGLGLLYSAQGIFTAEEVFELKRLAEPHLKAARYILVDLTEVEAIPMTKEELDRIGRQDRQLAEANPGIAQAIVGTSDFTFGMARMYENFANHEHWRNQVFRDLDSARDWIRAELRAVGCDDEPTFT